MENKLLKDNDLQLNKRSLMIDPANKHGMGQSKNSQKDEVRSDPIMVGRGMGEGGNPWKKQQRGNCQGSRENQQASHGLGPRVGWKFR